MKKYVSFSFTSRCTTTHTHTNTLNGGKVGCVCREWGGVNAFIERHPMCLLVYYLYTRHMHCAFPQLTVLISCGLGEENIYIYYVCVCVFGTCRASWSHEPRNARALSRPARAICDGALCCVHQRTTKPTAMPKSQSRTSSGSSGTTNDHDDN